MLARFVATIRPRARTIAGDLANLHVDINLIDAKKGTAAVRTQFANVLRDAHDDVSAFEHSIPAKLSTAFPYFLEANVRSAAGTLNTGIAAGLAYVATPTAARADVFFTDLNAGEDAWNTAINAMWNSLSLAGAPTIAHGPAD